MIRFPENDNNSKEKWSNNAYESPYSETAPYGSIIDNLRQWWQWDELAAEVTQESQARVAILGLVGCGKSQLYNRLRGFPVAKANNNLAGSSASGAVFLESFGAFVLADLPTQERLSMIAGEETILAVGDPVLVVYVLDGEAGVQGADYRWVSALRACGKPVLIALNKCDRLETPAEAVAQAEQQLGMRVIPISAATGDNIESRLLPAMMDLAPRLAVPLGREIVSMRRQAARRVVNRILPLVGIMSAQPVPLLDLPFQVLMQVGLVMRVGAVYGHPPSSGFRWEIAGVVASSLGLNYLAQTAVKFVPVLGWAVSGILGATVTRVLGEAAILYYEGAINRAGEATTEKLGWLARWPQRLARRLAQARPLPQSRRGQREADFFPEETAVEEIPVTTILVPADTHQGCNHEQNNVG